MSKKIIISESERKKILSLYGIINEAAEDDKFEIKAQNYFAPGYHSNLNSKIKQSITQQLLSAKDLWAVNDSGITPRNANNYHNDLGTSARNSSFTDCCLFCG